MRVPPGKEIEEIYRGEPEERVVVTKKFLRLLVDAIRELEAEHNE